MDYGTWRGVFTIIILVLFIALVIWAFSKRQRKSFDEAANSIFEENESSLNNRSDDQQESKKHE
ncbi:CcoQ/FixQ family Cbb3-type cytochrome c oxidase assembly chaperone [Idiomarina xiamenensis]|uniref:Cbb3-type cytochrome oxidase subunit 3 n=1 Tax=Idiomarina xiamenensis 10-D-4 TaxID=740709 RepID=K2KG69_9GAMM|nr:CcoQ/FixQ family Cbb3-type cytochrome c oxidase assembly chaperone [Idiomarina xiamenensis]EKE87003.1 Cbb3-type cytochrome oxidase subunit 3 [Idiomarina xiamenensis 10-D-4]